MTPVEAAAPPDAGQSAFWKSPAVLAAVGLIVLRIVGCGWIELFPEEAYYWNYARHLDIGYLDHPPMVAWLIALGTAVFGHGEFAVRVGALVCSAGTAVFVFKLTTVLYRDRRAATAAVLLVQALPFFFMSGWIMTPDAPLTACWAAMLYFLARVLILEDGRGWLGVGVALGLGMLSKYTIALLGPATLLFLALDPGSRVWFRRAAPYLGVLLAVAIFSPVIVWNARHHWASFAFQSTGRVHEARKFSLHHLAGAILAVLTPTGMYLAGRGLLDRNGSADGDRDGRRRVLFARLYTLVPLAVFVLFSLTHRVKLNWTGPLWLAVVPLLAAQVAALPNRATGRWLRTTWNVTVAALCLLYVALMQYLAFGLPGVGYGRQMELLPVGWRQMAREIDQRKTELQRAAPAQRVLVVGTDRDFIASEAAFYSPDPARAVRETTGTHLFGGVSLMYAYWFPPREQEGATLLLVSFGKDGLNATNIREHCGSLGPMEKRVIQVRGKPVRPYYLRVGYDYHSERKRP